MQKAWPPSWRSELALYPYLLTRKGAQDELLSNQVASPGTKMTEREPGASSAHHPAQLVKAAQLRPSGCPQPEPGHVPSSWPGGRASHRAASSTGMGEKGL